MESKQDQPHGHGTCADTWAVLPQLGLKICCHCPEILNKF